MVFGYFMNKSNIYIVPLTVYKLIRLWDTRENVCFAIKIKTFIYLI